MFISIASEARSTGIGFNLKPLDRSRELKMKTSAVFRYGYRGRLSKLPAGLFEPRVPVAVEARA